MTWEAIAGNSSLAGIIGTEEGFVAMSMHGVGFTLMAEETGRRREMEVLTGDYLAAIWFEMGVHEFIVIALQFLGLVLARGLAFPWAVVKSIGTGRDIVIQRMVPSSIINLKGRSANKSIRFIRSVGSQQTLLS